MEHIGYYLRNIYFENRVGQLFFQDGDIMKYLFFQNGELVHARSNETKELLGQILFQLGKISGRDFSRINEFIEPNRNIGEVLVENRMISREELNDGLQYQMREITLNIFSSFTGKFKFQEKEAILEENIKARLDIPELIEDGIRRIPYDTHFQSFMEQRTIVPRDKMFYKRLTKLEKDIVKALDETSPIESDQLCVNFDPEVFWKSLYLLYCLGLIDLKAEGGPREKEDTLKTSDIPGLDEKVNEVTQLSEQLQSLNYYEILSISRDATPAEVKKAYFELAREYHPDIFGRDLPEDIKEKIDNVFDYITKGYHTLTNENKREEYDKTLISPKESTQKEIQKGAEIRFRQGKTLFDQTRFDEALVLLEEAVRMNPNRSSYFLLLALTQSKLKPYQRQAVKNFKKAIEMDSWSSDGYIGLGMLYKKEGMSALASRQFEKALQIDPDNQAALKELNLLDSKSKKKGFKSLLSLEISDIFKKKK